MLYFGLRAVKHQRNWEDRSNHEHRMGKGLSVCCVDLSKILP